MSASRYSYQFPSMEAGRRRPDTPAVAHRTVRAAVAAARQTGLPLFAGGKSFGGRMTSQAQAAAPLPGIRGLVFLGYPLHPAAKPSTERARHLADVHIPMLFLQGTNDALAKLHLLTKTTARPQAATLSLIDDADHSFHVPVRSGRTDAEILDHLCLTASRWMRAALSNVAE